MSDGQAAPLAGGKAGDTPSIPPRPAYLRVDPDGIPPELLTLPQWVTWRAAWDGRKWTKKPYTPSGWPASSTDRATWSPWPAVWAAYHAETCDGVGLVLTPPLAGLDFDHVLAGDDLDGDVAALVAALDSYTEVSVSGTGVHVLAYADLPPFGRRNGPREAYNHGRYLTVSGRRWNSVPATINDRTELVRAYVATLAPERPSTPPALPPVPLVPVAPTGRYAEVGPRTRAYLDSTGPLRYASASEADAAAAAALVAAGYTAGEALALLAASARGHDAIERKGKHGMAYLARTVEHAAAHVGPVTAYPSGLRARHVHVTRPASAPAKAVMPV